VGTWPSRLTECQFEGVKYGHESHGTQTGGLAATVNYRHLHNLLNVMVQIANKMELPKNKSIGCLK
jgi:hypothetical protein